MMMTLAMNVLVICAMVCTVGAGLLGTMTYAQEWAGHEFGHPRLLLPAATVLASIGAATVWLGVAALQLPWGY